MLINSPLKGRLMQPTNNNQPTFLLVICDLCPFGNRQGILLSGVLNMSKVDNPVRFQLHSARREDFGYSQAGAQSYTSCLYRR